MSNINIEIDEFQRKLLVELFCAHKKGQIELTYFDIGLKLKVNEQDVSHNVNVLAQLGLLDDLPGESRACLSCLGIRFCKELAEIEKAEKPGLNKAKNDNAHEQRYIDWGCIINDAFDSFQNEIDTSTLSKTEKKKLNEVAKRFLEHPASRELLRRAIIKHLPNDKTKKLYPNKN